MKKVLSYLCFLLVLNSGLSAQEIIAQKEFPQTRWLKSSIPLEDGFLVLGHRHREEQIKQVITGYYTPFLVKLDFNMQPVWEQTFTESRHMNMVSMVEGEDGFYLFGNYYAPGSTRAQAQLVKVSKGGKVVFKKQYTYSNYNAVEGSHLMILPDGDLVAMARVYRNYNSYGSPWLLRFRNNGEKVWDKVLRQHYQIAPTGLKLSDNGNILIYGGTYEEKKHFDAENISALVMEVDPDAPEQVKVNKILRDHRDYYFSDVMQLESGGWWTIGRARVPADRISDLKDYTVLTEFDSNWNQLRQKKLSHKKVLIPHSFCWNEAESQLEIAGHFNRHPSWQGIHISLTADWVEVERREGEKGVSRQIFAYSDGTLLKVHKNQLQILR